MSDEQVINFQRFLLSEQANPYNSDKKFLFIVATGNESPYGVKPLETLQRIRPPDNVQSQMLVIYGNKEGLSSIYNRALDEFCEGYDFVVFAHDDLSINDCLVYDKLMDGKYDVIGVAGGKGWIPPDNPSQPCGWTVAARGSGMAGMMTHVADDGKLFQTFYGMSPSRTLTIDGSFMCFTKKVVGKLKFNDKFYFDFYDMALCMDAYKLGFKVGVVPILMTHQSQGLGVFKPEFMEAQRKFLNEYFV